MKTGFLKLDGDRGVSGATTNHLVSSIKASSAQGGSSAEHDARNDIHMPEFAVSLPLGLQGSLVCDQGQCWAAMLLSEVFDLVAGVCLQPLALSTEPCSLPGSVCPHLIKARSGLALNEQVFSLVNFLLFVTNVFSQRATCAVLEGAHPKPSMQRPPACVPKCHRLLQCRGPSLCRCLGTQPGTGGPFFGDCRGGEVVFLVAWALPI